MSAILGVPVEQHDDGSRPGMHDLNILYTDLPAAAVEITSAADAEMIAFYRRMNEGRWIEPALAGGWAIHVHRSAQWKRLERELPGLLRSWEEAGVHQFRPGRGTPDERLAAELRLTSAFRSGTSFPGSIYVMADIPPERAGGFVQPTGDALAEWLSEFLHSPARAGDRRKLALSRAAETHVFVIVPGLAAEAPFHVLDLVMRDDAPLPTVDPRLPDEITDVWAATAAPSGTGFRWSEATGWLSFAKPPA